MGAYSFDALREHMGHSVVVVGYGDPLANVAVECEECNKVLFDYNAGERNHQVLYEEEVEALTDSLIERMRMDFSFMYDVAEFYARRWDLAEYKGWFGFDSDCELCGRPTNERYRLCPLCEKE